MELTLSTYDTDWVLVAAGSASTAEEAWEGSGYTVRTADRSRTAPEGAS
jgi:hypothetical protein